MLFRYQRIGLLLDLSLQSDALCRRVFLADDRQLLTNGNLGRLRLLQGCHGVPAFLYAAGDNKLYETRRVRETSLLVARRLLQRLRFLRTDAVLIAELALVVLEERPRSSLTTRRPHCFCRRRYPPRALAATGTYLPIAAVHLHPTAIPVIRRRNDHATCVVQATQ